jgi:hypothetical protein
MKELAGSTNSKIIFMRCKGYLPEIIDAKSKIDLHLSAFNLIDYI